jgi:hypothetical protein
MSAIRSDSKAVLETLFNPGEQIYATPDKFASSKNEDGSWRQYRPSINQDEIDENETRFLSINPLVGDTRNDKNVTAFRSFLFEMDNMPVNEQLEYVEKNNIPYSLCVFSGGKSLHFVVTLNEDLPNITVYKFYYEWLLRTIPEADQATKNPSRGMRFPGVIRPETGKKQVLVKSNGRISMASLLSYLSQFPHKMPVKKKPKLDLEVSNNDVSSLPGWIKRGMINGFDFSKGRNQTWFAVGGEFAKCGFNLETVYNVLESRYNEEDTFPRSEWETAIKKGFNKGKESLNG